MAFADWLLPLLLLTADDEHGRVPFDWSPPSPPPLVGTSGGSDTSPVV
jgi:hypothetical protein